MSKPCLPPTHELPPSPQQPQSPTQSHDVFHEPPPNLPPTQVMVEKIVKLQRQLARRTEKVEFLEEHVRQLLEELQRKSKIIQHFALREETGVLAPESADLNRLLEATEKVCCSSFCGLSRCFVSLGMGRHGGGGGGAGVGVIEAELASRGETTMGSMFGGKKGQRRLGTDPALNLDLSLQISAKLQALLEDTLHKNITLKTSMDTLGAEISRLSRENRELQLKSSSSNGK